MSDTKKMNLNAAAATGSGNDNSMSFPLNMPNFIQKEPVKIICKAPYVIELHDSDFIPGARSYSDLKIDATNPSGAARVLMMQLWLFALRVMKVRIDRNIIKTSEYPVSVYLEALYEYDEVTGNPRLTNGQRLWIFEEPSCESGMLMGILQNAVLSNKTFDASGCFDDSSVLHNEGGEVDGTGQSKQVSSAAVSAGGGDGNSGAKPKKQKNGPSGAGESTTAKKFRLEEMYRAVQDGPCYAALRDGLTGLIDSTRKSRRMRVSHVNMTAACSIGDVLRRAPKDRIIVQQLMIENYLPPQTPRADGTLEWVLPFYEATFQIPVMCFWPEYFFTRAIPWWQVEPKQVSWNNFMEDTCQLVMKKAEEVRARMISGRKRAVMLADRQALKKQRAQEAGEEEDGDEDEGEEEEELGTIDGIGELDGTAERTSRTMENVALELQQRMTKEKLSDIFQHYGIIRELENGGKINDYIESLQRLFAAQEAMIEYRYEDEPDKKAKMLETLCDIMLSKFEAFCMHQNSDVSKAQKTLNKEFLEKGLGDHHMNVPITDPSKTSIENFMIFLERGFTAHGGIATAQHICTFGFFMGGDRFRRELTMHLNLLLCGPNSTGKSEIQKILMRCFCAESCVQRNSSSAQADAWQHVETDGLVFGDDISPAAINDPTKPERSASDKSQMTTMTTTRTVLEVDPERKAVDIRGIDIHSKFANTNESLHRAEVAAWKNEKGTGVGGVSAWWTRWLCFEMPYYNNNIFNVEERTSNYENKSETRRKAEEDFFLGLQRAHTIVGWAQKLMSISKRLVRVDMSCFDLVWNKLVKGLGYHGVSASHRRIYRQGRDLCKQIVLMDAYITRHCIQGAPFYGEKFNIRQIRTWTPICFEHHVIITLSALYYDFYPPVVTPVMDVMRDLANDVLKEDSGESIDKRVRFPEVVKTISEVRRKHEENEEAKRRMQADEEHRMQLRVLVDSAIKDRDIGGRENNQPSRESIRERAVLEAALIGQHTRNYVGPNGGAPHPPPPPPPPPRQNARGAPPPPAAVAEPITADCNRIEFRCSLEVAAKMIEMRMKAMNMPVIWGQDSIISAMKRMTTRMVRCYPMTVNIAQNEQGKLGQPTKKSGAQLAKMPLLSVSADGRSFTVCFPALLESHDDLRVLRDVIKGYCNQLTMPRDILLAIDHPRFPFLYQSVRMVRRNHKLMMDNPSFEQRFLAYGTGQQIESSQTYRTMGISVEVNALAVRSYFATELKLGEITTEEILKYTPENQVKAFMRVALKIMVTGSNEERGVICNYPRDMEVELILMDLAERENLRKDNQIMVADDQDSAAIQDREEHDDDFLKQKGVTLTFDEDGNPVISDEDLEKLLITKAADVITGEDSSLPKTRILYDARVGQRATIDAKELWLKADPNAEKALTTFSESLKRTRLSTETVKNKARGDFAPGSEEEKKARQEVADAIKAEAEETLKYGRLREARIADYSKIGDTPAVVKERQRRDMEAKMAQARERERNAKEPLVEEPENEFNLQLEEEEEDYEEEEEEEEEEKKNDDDDDDDNDDDDDDGSGPARRQKAVHKRIKHKHKKNKKKKKKPSRYMMEKILEDF